MFFFRQKTDLVTESAALPGREVKMPVAKRHAVLGTPMEGPWPEGFGVAMFAMGCFWGAERVFWKLEGVHSTAVGYAGGFTPNPTYQEVCSGKTAHTEVVQVVWDPAMVGFSDLLKVFWESHDPTQGMRQGNDSGTQYRSAIYVDDEGLLAEADRSKEAYGVALSQAGMGGVTTEVGGGKVFFFGEDYHQQHLFKNPSGYCNIGGTGISCPAPSDD